MATAKELEIARKVQEKIESATAPLEREMRVMKWRPEYQVIVWEALARHVVLLLAEAQAKMKAEEAS